jgi:L-glyceraldehyde 3-phosphate reductase
MAQLAIAWTLRGGRVTSALIGASRPEQIDDVVAGLKNLDFSDDQLQAIEAILAE